MLSSFFQCDSFLQQTQQIHRFQQVGLQLLLQDSSLNPLFLDLKLKPLEEDFRIVFLKSGSNNSFPFVVDLNGRFHLLPVFLLMNKSS